MRNAFLGLLALGAAACAREPVPVDAADAAPQELVITATDFGYVLPAAPIHAGLTTITLVNQGKELHQVTLVQLTEGKTAADFAQMNMDGPPPTWMVAAGGPNAAMPGGESSATLILEPGLYMVTCFIPSPDGVPHIAKGMVMPMDVQPAGAATAPIPSGDIAMDLFDYGFSLSQPPTAGSNTFTVTNSSAQAHEVVVVRLEPGATIEAWLEWDAAGMQGPAPGAAFAGIAAIAPGMVQNFTMELAPGTYGLICFVPDAGDAKPHLVHGMVTTFEVS